MEGGSRTRRRLLMGASTGVGLVLARRVAADGGPTPRQTEGPFYPPAMPADHDTDLVRVAGADAQAMGTVTHVMGRVLDTRGRPVPGALVEVWQCDAKGHYLHPADRGPRDPGFQGFGASSTDAAGGYRFRTIRPVAYPGRTPHIHVRVKRDGRELLTTQMYVADEPGNERDGIWRRLDAAERARVTVPLRAAPEIEAAALAGIFDIVVAA